VSASKSICCPGLTTASACNPVALQVAAEYNMSQSASPRETEDVEQPAPSPDENEQQPPDAEMNRADDPGDHGLGYDFEVKEQDRWLPIANGE